MADPNCLLVYRGFRDWKSLKDDANMDQGCGDEGEECSDVEYGEPSEPGDRGWLCVFEHCEYSTWNSFAGFSTENALIKHVLEVHQEPQDEGREKKVSTKKKKR